MIFPVITEKEKKLPVYITGIGVQKEQEPTYRPDGFNYHQWIICSKGRGLLKIDGQEILIDVGMGFYFSEGIPHSYVAIDEPWETKWVTFNGDYYHDLRPLLGMGHWGVFRPHDWAKTNRLFADVYRLIKEDNIDKVIDTAGHLYQMLLMTKENHNRLISANRHSNSVKLQPVIYYMENNYSDYITLEELADVIHVTSYYLCKLFNSAFGISPMHYLIRIRLQVAKGLLIRKPDMTVKMIAEAVSYQDASYFCSIFKKQEQVTPSEFRRLSG